MGLLTQNSKMSKTSTAYLRVMNWSIRAGVSCPYAGDCNKPGKCYAQSGMYNYPTTKAKHEANLALTKTDFFVPQMKAEIQQYLNTATKKKQTLVIRIHDAGDFYSLDYLLKWLEIINEFPGVTFYCYTKGAVLFKRLPGKLPFNFVVNYSMGGLADRWVNQNTDRHVHIFATEEELLAAGYVRNDADDSLAFEPSVTRIGLVARHGIAPTYKGPLSVAV